PLLSVAELLRPLPDPPDRVGRFFAASGRVAQLRRDRRGAGGGAAGPFGEQPSSGGSFVEPVAELADRTGGAAQPGPELRELCLGPAGLDELAAEPPGGGHMPRDRRGADHGPHPGLRGDAALPSGQQSEVPVGGDRALFGRRDENEWRLPAGADGTV